MIQWTIIYLIPILIGKHCNHTYIVIRYMHARWSKCLCFVVVLSCDIINEIPHSSIFSECISSCEKDQLTRFCTHYNKEWIYLVVVVVVMWQDHLDVILKFYYHLTVYINLWFTKTLHVRIRGAVNDSAYDGSRSDDLAEKKVLFWWEFFLCDVSGINQVNKIIIIISTLYCAVYILIKFVWSS